MDGPNPNNPYEFFMSNQSPQAARPFIGGNNSSTKQRVIIVAGGAVLLIFLLVIVFGVLLKGGNKGVEQMYQVAASQQDLIALTDFAKSEIKDQQLQNTTATINAVVTTHLAQTTVSINKIAAAKISTPKIAALRDKTYETSLNNAKTNNTYDATFTTVLSNRIDLYRTHLQEAYSAVTGQTLKNQLNDEYIQINQLKLTK